MKKMNLLKNVLKGVIKEYDITHIHVLDINKNTPVFAGEKEAFVDSVLYPGLKEKVMNMTVEKKIVGKGHVYLFIDSSSI